MDTTNVIQEKKNEEEVIEEEDQSIDPPVKNKKNTIIDPPVKTKTSTTTHGNENIPRSRKIPLENLPDAPTTSKKTRRDRPTVINPIKISKRKRYNNRRRRSKDHRIIERERERTITREIRRYKVDEETKTPKSKNNKVEQSTYEICKRRFGIIADPRFSITKNADHIIMNNNPNDIPRKPSNLECHNLCRNPEAVTEEILETLGLNLTFGISLPPKKDKLPIDFDRLQRSVRLCFTPFDKKNDEIDIPKLRSRSKWEPDPAPKMVEDALTRFKTSITKAFENSWSRPHIVNIEKRKVDLLRLIKKERKFIVIATDKTLGPAIMEIEYYIHRCLTDHLDDTDTYKVLSETEARQINVDNFRFICEHFIDDPKANLTKQARDFFINNCI